MTDLRFTRETAPLRRAASYCSRDLHFRASKSIDGSLLEPSTIPGRQLLLLLFRVIRKRLFHLFLSVMLMLAQQPASHCYNCFESDLSIAVSLECL